jgi:hypothetical protein
MKIIVRLLGGIGNKFFQYAAGRSLAIRHKADLLLDCSLLKRRRYGLTPRDYELEAYNIQARRLQKREQSLLQFRVQRPFRYLYDVGLLKSSFKYYREPHYQFDPKLSHFKGDLIIEGYWQSERYFADIADKLRHELRPVFTPPESAGHLLDQVQSVNSISLHVRRGDYISCRRAAAHFFPCDHAYYRRATQIMAERISNPVFFIFSDDPGWVLKELRIDFPMVLASHPESWPAHEDLRLMSHCHHHIIANSSFSWWGAWLNPNPNKIVVAPMRWFRILKNTQDLIPREWHLV